jgi:biotin operon repressor
LILTQKGMSAPRIAQKLKISRAAVYYHLANLRENGDLKESA